MLSYWITPVQPPDRLLRLADPFLPFGASLFGKRRSEAVSSGNTRFVTTRGTLAGYEVKKISPMKTALLRVGLFVAFIITSDAAIAENSLAFPEQKIGLPGLSLAAFARGESRSNVKSDIPLIVGGPSKSSPVLPLSDDKFVIKPDDSVDYKLAIKAPDASVDYRLIVKNPDALRKK